MTKNKLLQDVWSFFAFAMMLMGIGGLIFNTFKPNGWASLYFGQALTLGLTHPLTSGIVLLAVGSLGWACLSGRLMVGNKTSAWQDIPVYLLICAGIYFSYAWLKA